MAAHNELGKWGEDLAADYLQRKGYTIIEQPLFNLYRCTEFTQQPLLQRP